jgi:myo-inositol 2-dehydrogenase / D-chiro-inositol 1-dehydrogenase
VRGSRKRLGVHMALEIAFYGAGTLARPYLEALGRRSDVHVKAVCDVDRRAAEQTAAGWGARVFLSYEAMLEEAGPNALWVCVPPHLQGDVILRAAERAIPFFVEPPGAVNYERARLYGRLVEEMRLVTAVGFSGRHADVALEAREYIGANVVPLALGWWLCPPSDEGLSTTAPGQLWTDACRLVDEMRYFCGEVRRVRALSAGPGAEPGGLVVQLEFASGTVGMLTCASFARPEPRIELQLLGEGWSLSFGRDLATLRVDERDKTTILRCLNSPAEQQTTAFLDAVMNDRPGGGLATYAEALHTLAVCQAAAVSAREGRAVEVAEVEHLQADSGGNALG